MVPIEAAGHPLRIGLSPGRGRVVCHLRFEGLDRSVALPTRPSAVRRVLFGDAWALGLEVSLVERCVTGAIADLAWTVGGWAPRPNGDLVAAAGGAAYPALGALYDLGAAPLGEVPRWCAPALTEPTFAAAVRALFGPAATRRLIRTAAQSLTPAGPGDEVQLPLLGVVLMGVGTIDSDRLAALFEAEGPVRADPSWPSREIIASVRPMIGAVGAQRGARILTDVIARPDGPSLIEDLARMWPDVSERVTVRPPSGLHELHDRCRVLLRSRPPVPPRPEPQPRPRLQLQPRLQPRPTPPVRSVSPAVAAATRSRQLTPVVEAPPTLGVRSLPSPAGGIDGATAGPYRLVAPRTTADLDRWGRLLRSCVGSFGEAVATRRSTVIGSFREDRLVHCIELTPDRTIRQFLGHANRPPAHAARLAIVDALVRAGAIEPTDPRNAAWLQRG